MKTKLSVLLMVTTVAAASVLFASCTGYGEKEPWTAKQLIEPSELATLMNASKTDKPVIYSIGFEADIKGSVDMGPVKDDAQLQKFKNAVSKLPKNANIVIYCGCCPFEHCPNIRPAFNALNELGFTNQKLLNLSHNIKTDWIDKGYPIN